MLRRNERPGHRLYQPARGKNAPREALALLHLGEHGPRDPRGAAHWRGRHIGHSSQPHDLLDEIDWGRDVRPPGRRGRLNLLALAVEFDAERFELMLDLACTEIEPAQACDQAGIELEGGVRLRCLAGDLDLARLSAAKLKHEPRGKLKPRDDESGIDTPLEPEARIGLDVEPAPSARRALRIEISRTR